MASSSSSSTSPSFFACVSLVCFFLLLFVIENKPFVSAALRKQDSELQLTHHHRVPLSSFFPSSACTSAPQGAGIKGSLSVVHEHGPCSELKQQMSSSPLLEAPSHREVLEQDKARVRSIKSKLWEEQQSRIGTTTAEARLPARSSEVIDKGAVNYFVRVGLGTPARELSLVFDTASDLTWTQCLPCPASCYPQKEPLFDPSQSSSYVEIPCSSSLCYEILPDAGISYVCSTILTNCFYGIGYADKSGSGGTLASETLTVTPTHVIDNFLFGCGYNNLGLFRGTAGLLGLGRNRISFVEQTSDIFHRIFSYCLPPTASDVGYLTFGLVPDSDNITYVPFSSVSGSSSFYALNLTGISFAGTGLPIPSDVFSSGMIIDSGTVITRLPSAAYGPLRDAFRKAMSMYPMADPVSILDTCYDLSGHKDVVVPKVTLSFGDGVNVDLDASGVVYALSETQVCLAFAVNKDPNDISIIGNIQQRTLEVVYDVGAGKVGFRSGGCP